MGQAIALRGDYTAEQLRRQAGRMRHRRRLLAIAAIPDGTSWVEVARQGGMELPNPAGLGDPI